MLIDSISPTLCTQQQNIIDIHCYLFMVLEASVQFQFSLNHFKSCRLLPDELILCSLVTLH